MKHIYQSPDVKIITLGTGSMDIVRTSGEGDPYGSDIFVE